MQRLYFNAPDGWCTEEEVQRFVHEFYALVQRDDLIGPVFNERVRSWPEHLAVMVQFWSSLLLGTKAYRGTPMTTHMQLPDLTQAHFERWLQLFRETLRNLGNADVEREAHRAAERIANAFWGRYVTEHHGHRDAAELITGGTAR